jgi:hypothetical protein
MGDKFWYSDYTILFNKDRIIEFIPNNSMSLTEKLNALVRFSIYLSIVLFIYNKNYIMFYIPIVIAGLTLLLDNYESFTDISQKKNDKTQKNPHCVQNYKAKSTKNNPFMNVLISDYMKDPRRSSAPVYYNNKEIKKEVTQNFNTNLYRDIGDVFQNSNSQREFYTMPNTKIPNDQTSFAEWCYKGSNSCKEGNGYQCDKNIFRELNR